MAGRGIHGNGRVKIWAADLCHAGEKMGLAEFRMSKKHKMYVGVGGQGELTAHSRVSHMWEFTT